jgi:hypothetical protein
MAEARFLKILAQNEANSGLRSGGTAGFFREIIFAGTGRL